MLLSPCLQTWESPSSLRPHCLPLYFEFYSHWLPKSFKGYFWQKISGINKSLGPCCWLLFLDTANAICETGLAEQIRVNEDWKFIMRSQWNAEKTEERPRQKGKEGQKCWRRKKSMEDAEEKHGLSKEVHDSKQVWGVQSSFRYRE